MCTVYGPHASMACTLGTDDRETRSVLLGIMCHAACASSLLLVIFTVRFSFWCFSLPSISWFCKPASPAAPAGLEDHGREPPRPGAFAPGPAADRATSPPRMQVDDINSAATGRGGADRARSGFIIVAIGECDTPMPNTWPNTRNTIVREYERRDRRSRDRPARGTTEYRSSCRL